MDLAPKFPKEIFPLEVFTLILNNLESPYDLANCYRTCQAWAELLKTKRTTFLMLEVFPMIYKWLMAPVGNDGSESCHDSDESDDSESDEESNATNPTEVLKLRTISRSWKTSVDDYHQNHSIFRDMQCFLKNFKEETLHQEPFPLLPYHFDVLNLTKLEGFGKKKFCTDCNPFITRYVKLSDNIAIYCPTLARYSNLPHLRRLQPRLRKSFLKLLKGFGSQIWNFRLYLTSFKSQAEVYHLVHTYLSLMPNLRSLDIVIHEVEENAEERNKLEECNKLEALVKTKPFPKMESLNIFHTYEAPDSVTAGILMQSKNVQKLIYSSLSQIYSDVIQPVTRSMKCRANMVAGHLENIPDSILNIKSTHLDEMSFVLLSKSDLLQLRKLNWPLKALCLELDTMEIAIVFEVVSTFSVTLEHLILDQSNVESNVELQKLRLELPNLKKFKLHTIFELETIDFLVGCSALEEIELKINVANRNTFSENEEGSASVIQFNGYINRMQNSNIWHVLLKL